MELMLIQLFCLTYVSDNGDLTLNGLSDGTGFSSDVLTTPPSSLEDEGVGEGFHGRVFRSLGLQLLIC